MDAYTKMKLDETKKGRLVYTIGLPRSGKSTWARKWAFDLPGRVIVNRDSVRLGLHGQGYLQERETEVKHIDMVMVKALLNDGFDVLVDETNTVPADREYWQSLGGIGVFFDTSLETCLNRIKSDDPSFDNLKDAMKNIFFENLKKYPPVWEKDFIQYIGGN